MRHIVHITGLWHHRLKTVKLFLEPICVRFRVAKSPFLGAQFIRYGVAEYVTIGKGNRFSVTISEGNGAGNSGVTEPIL